MPGLQQNNSQTPFFLLKIDSHVEVTYGWLEPILDRFAKDMNIMVWPKVN